MDMQIYRYLNEIPYLRDFHLGKWQMETASLQQERL